MTSMYVPALEAETLLKVSVLAEPLPIQPTYLPPEAQPSLCTTAVPPRVLAELSASYCVPVLLGEAATCTFWTDVPPMEVTVTGLMPACRYTEAVAVAIEPDVDGSEALVTGCPFAVSARWLPLEAE